MSASFKSFLKFIGLLIIVAFLGWYIGFLSQVKNVEPLNKSSDGTEANTSIRRFPELQGPKELIFQWNYQKKPYELKFTLYKSVYDFYRSSPKEYSYTGNLPKNWEEEYYGMFLKQNPIDRTIPELAAQLKTLGLKNHLSDDQLAEMTVAFVQSITYDNERAKKIEQDSPTEKPNYPYEILYDQQGVCSDKSFLLTALLKEMGYGTALFEYKDQKHIAMGIKCPVMDSTYSSEYCYTETTQPGHKIGIVPNISREDNSAIVKKELGAFDSIPNQNGTEQAEQQQINTEELGSVAIYQKNDGKIYNGIIETLKTETRIDSLEKDIATLKEELTPVKAQLDKDNQAIDDLTKKMDQLKKNKDYAIYNSLVPDYNKQVSVYKKNSSAYNQKVNLYNQKVTEYNKLIKQFYE